MGVAALLIYSDPAEDGFKQGRVFPDGPWGPETHIQRGAITYDFIVPGDPLTPGWASVPGAKRIPESEARSLPHLVALPLSWHDAKPLLENMNGPVAPKEWQGGLPFTYHLTGAVQAHVNVKMDNSTQPYYVVEGRIRGSEFPDEWVLLGNHHDAWEYGGVDPSSGTASMMELTRSFGSLLKSGTRPKRTLVFCSWDGEEIGLTGSTEWGEQFADELRHKLIAYLNVDSSASGPNFEGGAVGFARANAAGDHAIHRRSQRRESARCVAQIRCGFTKTEKQCDGKRFECGEYAPGQRFRSHSISKFSRAAGDYPAI